MEKQTLGFLEHLEFFLLSDDRARWKTIGWIIIVVGVCGSIDLALIDAPIDDAVLLMGVLAVIMSVGSLAWYCSIRPNRNPGPLPSRRSLALQAIGSAAALLIGVSLSRFQARALDSALLQATKTNDYESATRVFQRAIAASVHLDGTLVKKTSQRLLNATEKPAAWDAAVASVDYSSFLNASKAPTERKAKYILIPAGVSRIDWTAKGPGPETEWTFNVHVFGNHYLLLSTDIVTSDRAARFETLGSTENVARTTGDKALIVDGMNQATILLDDTWIKNTVIRNATIGYDGGRTDLESVYFVKCEFRLSQNQNGRELASKILDSPTVTFKAN